MLHHARPYNHLSFTCSGVDAFPTFFNNANVKALEGLKTRDSPDGRTDFDPAAQLVGPAGAHAIVPGGTGPTNQRGLVLV